MFRRLAFILVPALLIFAAALFFNREPLILTALAQKAPRTTLEEHKALIASGIEFRAPKGAYPPYPAVIQFHGCAGIRQPFMDQWADVANEAGYMAVIVDSFGPRGITRERALKTVCEGKELIGQARAADALAAYEIVRNRIDVDPEKIALAGWSHGAWTVMDLIALDPPRRLPAGLSGHPSAPFHVAGAILVYPYCGLGAWTRSIGWRHPPKTLALIAGADTIVDPKACPRVFTALNRAGADAEVHVYEGVDHVFDDPFLEPEYQSLYNAETHADASARYKAFLEDIAR